VLNAPVPSKNVAPFPDSFGTKPCFDAETLPVVISVKITWLSGTVRVLAAGGSTAAIADAVTVTFMLIILFVGVVGWVALLHR